MNKVHILLDRYKTEVLVIMLTLIALPLVAYYVWLPMWEVAYAMWRMILT